MTTSHKINFCDSRYINNIPENSVDLVVTSPPYPMIEMWDSLFSSMNGEIGDSIQQSDGITAFELMHKELDKVWNGIACVIKENGFVCINIGDATRKIGDDFQLYPNQSRITSKFMSLGFQSLPLILWHKSTNAPNKFMGSGMLPAGAYVTMEHEYILIFRKGGKRHFDSDVDKENRNKSSFFWEERNTWFSDTWNIPGVKQVANNENVREKTAAYPFELPYRLINMYSVKGDIVFDPFLGTGTTTFAAMASERNSIGIEHDNNFSPIITDGLVNLKKIVSSRITKRLNDHIAFCEKYQKEKGLLKYKNKCFDFPVMTKQEIKMELKQISDIICTDFENMMVEYVSIF